MDTEKEWVPSFDIRPHGEVVPTRLYDSVGKVPTRTGTRSDRIL